jgi:MscS family membrane protein
MYIPNGVFSQIAVENPSRMQNRRIKETIGIRYDDAGKMEAITGQVETMLKNHPEIDSNKTLMVHFNSFAPSSLDFFIYTFTKTTNWEKYHVIKQDILLNILKIIEQNGAEAAFPTSTIHLANQNVLKNP